MRKNLSSMLMIQPSTDHDMYVQQAAGTACLPMMLHWTSFFQDSTHRMLLCTYTLRISC